ncbi:inositol polyphosphate kinase [Cystoisospora suis]|uniref:Inositol polyphosphate kinase n=1 Tax=Cystoisospora suis TaxID=483139 RepID=A0A2C6LBT2_9APIC|nr:inositol polyphosphate kinase [Cystoisospora suis]
MDSPATSASSPVVQIGTTFYVPAGGPPSTSPSPPSSPSHPLQVASSPPSLTKSLSDLNGSEKQCSSPPHLWPCASSPRPHASHEYFLEDVRKYSAVLSERSQAQQQNNHRDENELADYGKERKYMTNGEGGRDHEEAPEKSLIPKRIVQDSSVDVPSPAVFKQNSFPKNLLEQKKKTSDSACVLNGEKSRSAYDRFPSAAFCSATSFPLLQSRSGSDSSLSFNETSRGIRRDLSSSSSLLFSRSSSFPTGFRQGEQEEERKCEDDEVDVSCELNKKEEGSSVTRSQSSSLCSIKGTNPATDMSMLFLKSSHGEHSGFTHTSSPCSPTPLSGEAGTTTDNNGEEEGEQGGEAVCDDPAETSAVYSFLLAGLEIQDQQAKETRMVAQEEDEHERNDLTAVVDAVTDGHTPSSSFTGRPLGEEAIGREEGSNERGDKEEGQPQVTGGGGKNVSIDDDKNEARVASRVEGGEEKKNFPEGWSCRRDVRRQEERHHDKGRTRGKETGEEEDAELKIQRIDEGMDSEREQEEEEDQQHPQGAHEIEGLEQVREREEVKKTISAGVYTPSSNCLSPPVLPRGHSPFRPPSGSPARSLEGDSRQRVKRDVKDHLVSSSSASSSSSSPFSPPLHHSFSAPQEAWQFSGPTPSSFPAEKKEVKSIEETAEKHDENLGVRFPSLKERGRSFERYPRIEEDEEQSPQKSKERRDERFRSRKKRVLTQKRIPAGTGRGTTFGVIMSENFLPCFSRKKGLPQGGEQGCDYFLHRLKRVLSTRTFPWNDTSSSPPRLFLVSLEMGCDPIRFTEHILLSSLPEGEVEEEDEEEEESCFYAPRLYHLLQLKHEGRSLSQLHRRCGHNHHCRRIRSLIGGDGCTYRYIPENNVRELEFFQLVYKAGDRSLSQQDEEPQSCSGSLSPSSKTRRRRRTFPYIGDLSLSAPFSSGKSPFSKSTSSQSFVILPRSSSSIWYPSLSLSSSSLSSPFNSMMVKKNTNEGVILPSSFSCPRTFEQSSFSHEREHDGDRPRTSSHVSPSSTNVPPLRYFSTSSFSSLLLTRPSRSSSSSSSPFSIGAKKHRESSVDDDFVRRRSSLLPRQSTHQSYLRDVDSDENREDRDRFSPERTREKRRNMHPPSTKNITATGRLVKEENTEEDAFEEEEEEEETEPITTLRVEDDEGEKTVLEICQDAPSVPCHHSVLPMYSRRLLSSRKWRPFSSVFDSFSSSSSSTSSSCCFSASQSKKSHVFSSPPLLPHRRSSSSHHPYVSSSPVDAPLSYSFTSSSTSSLLPPSVLQSFKHRRRLHKREHPTRSAVSPSLPSVSSDGPYASSCSPSSSSSPSPEKKTSFSRGLSKHIERDQGIEKSTSLLPGHLEGSQWFHKILSKGKEASENVVGEVRNQIIAAASRVAASLGDGPSPSSFAEIDLPSNSFSLSSEISCTTSSSSPSDCDVDSDRSISSDSPRSPEEGGPPSSSSSRNLHCSEENSGACVDGEIPEEAAVPSSHTRQGKAENIEGIVDEGSGEEAQGMMSTLTPTNATRKRVKDRKTREKEEREERSKKGNEKREKDKKISTSMNAEERGQKDPPFSSPSSFIPSTWSRAHSHISQGLSSYWSGMVSEKSLSKAFDALLGGGGREYNKSSTATGSSCCSSHNMDSNRKVHVERSSSCSPLRSVEVTKKKNAEECTSLAPELSHQESKKQIEDSSSSFAPLLSSSSNSTPLKKKDSGVAPSVRKRESDASQSLYLAGHDQTEEKGTEGENRDLLSLSRGETRSAPREEYKESSPDMTNSHGESFSSPSVCRKKEEEKAQQFPGEENPQLYRVNSRIARFSSSSPSSLNSPEAAGAAAPRAAQQGQQRRSRQGLEALPSLVEAEEEEGEEEEEEEGPEERVSQSSLEFLRQNSLIFEYEGTALVRPSAASLQDVQRRKLFKLLCENVEKELGDRRNPEEGRETRRAVSRVSLKQAEKQSSSGEKDKMLETSPALSVPFDQVIPYASPSGQQEREDDDLSIGTQMGWRGRGGRQRGEEEENDGDPSLAPSSSTSVTLMRRGQEGISTYPLVWELGGEDAEESSKHVHPTQRGKGKRLLDSHVTTLGGVGGEGGAGSLNGGLLMMKLSPSVRHYRQPCFVELKLGRSYIGMHPGDVPAWEARCIAQGVSMTKRRLAVEKRKQVKDALQRTYDPMTAIKLATNLSAADVGLAELAPFLSVEQLDALLKSWSQEEKIVSSHQWLLGFRLSYVTFVEPSNAARSRSRRRTLDRSQCASLGAQQVSSLLRRLFRIYPAMASKCVVKLSALLEWLRHQREFRFYSTSLVLFFDASDPLTTCDCRWDSFSNIVRCHENERRSLSSDGERSKDTSPAREKNEVVSSSSSSLVQGGEGRSRSYVDMKGCNEEEKEKNEKESEEEEDERMKDKAGEKKNAHGVRRDNGMHLEGGLPKREGEGRRDHANKNGNESDDEEGCEKKKKDQEEKRNDKDIERRGQIDQDVNEGIRHGLTILLNIARDCLWGRKERKKVKKTLEDGE